MAIAEEPGGMDWRRLFGLAALTVLLGVGAFFALTQITGSGSERSDTYGGDISQQCIDDTAAIADERADAVQELGADAPITDFHFPESCFE